jgi:hypothetical protein
MKLRTLFSTCLFVASAPVLAHGPSPQDRFCPGGQPVVVAQFNYTPLQLQQYGDCLADPLNACTQDMPPDNNCALMTCGEFDDDYGVANRLAFNYCATFDTSSTGTGTGSTRAQVTGPSTYSSPSHHLDYSFSGSLYGSCLRCTLTANNTGKR